MPLYMNKKPFSVPADEDSEVITGEEEKNFTSQECLPQDIDTVSEESCISSIVDKGEADGFEVQSPKTSHRGN